MTWMHTATGESSSSTAARASLVQEYPILPSDRDPPEFPLNDLSHINEQLEENSIQAAAILVNGHNRRQHRTLPLKLDTGHEIREYKSPEPSSRSSSESSQMGRKAENRRPASKATGGQNGHASGSMELRRKHLSLESPTATSQTARLMDRDDFSLNEKPPLTPSTPTTDTSFFDLPRQDRRNFLLLVLLYFLQGIPMGLASGSVPFLLKSHLSYGQIGVFTLASYPYSLKLLWSPIVDAVWSPAIGRRKSWILPIQTLSGLGMIYLGGRIKDMMVSAGAIDGSGVWAFTGWWFFLVFLCATQDIAVDGTQNTFHNHQMPPVNVLQAGPLPSCPCPTSHMLQPLRQLALRLAISSPIPSSLLSILPTSLTAGFALHLAMWES